MNELLALALELGPDERRVLTQIARRLKFGAERYGRLDLATDGRAFREREAREEIEDFLVYAACAWLREIPADRENRSDDSSDRSETDGG